MSENLQKLTVAEHFTVTWTAWVILFLKITSGTEENIYIKLNLLFDEYKIDK